MAANPYQPVPAHRQLQISFGEQVNRPTPVFARVGRRGVDDALRDVPGVTTAMLVTFGENEIKTVEDLAGCATDDLVGWSERKDGENIKHAGFLEDISREEAEAMIMQARVKAGWITEADLAQPAAEEAAAETVETTA